MEAKMFSATHNQTGEVKYGYFTELCDLDKRVWTLKRSYHSEPSGSEPKSTPLATIRLSDGYGIVPCYIYDLAGLEDVYIGR